VSRESKTPLLAKFARNGAPSHEETLHTNAVTFLAGEHWPEPRLIVSYKSKAPLLAKNARNGAPESDFEAFLNLSQRSVEFSAPTKSNR
jgi:hypothetical protein